VNFPLRELVENRRSPKRNVVPLISPEDLASEKSLSHFTVEPNSGDLLLLRPLKSSLSYALELSARDDKGLEATTVLDVDVEDVNDHSPEFARAEYKYRVQEGHYHEHLLGQVVAKDGDLGENGRVKYHLPSAKDDVNFPFAVNRESGAIFVNGSVDHEGQKGCKFWQFFVRNSRLNSVHKFEVVASDSAPEYPMQEKTRVHVEVVDRNDNPPR